MSTQHDKILYYVGNFTGGSSYGEYNNRDIGGARYITASTYLYCRVRVYRLVHNNVMACACIVYIYIHIKNNIRIISL